MNYKRYVLLFNIFFLLLLIAATLLFELKPGIAGTNFRSLDILSDVIRDSANQHNIANINNAKKNKKNGNIEQRDYTSYQGLINNTDNPTALFDFFSHLQEMTKKKRKKIRIAYFGDSMIEADLITEDLRRMLQDYFGGGGTGFVPVTSIVSGLRRTIVHSFSSNWDEMSYKSDDKAAGNLFISGHSFFSTNKSEVTYRTTNLPRLDNFSNVSVLYGSPVAGNSLDATIFVNDSAYPVTAANLFNKLDLQFNNSKAIKIEISSNAIPVYGAAFEADSGIVLDNFSFRGISGTELNYFSEEYLRQVQAARPYDLMIFHYGPNLLFKPNITDFSWYTRKMLPTLQKIKSSFPQTSLLLISTADKGFRSNGDWHTEKSVRPLIDAQYTMATSTGIDFFNLYNAMGGEDAIVQWVNADTVLANKDYTHANRRGAKKIAELIFNAIMKEYKQYEKFSDK